MDLSKGSRRILSNAKSQFPTVEFPSFLQEYRIPCIKLYPKFLYVDLCHENKLQRLLSVLHLRRSMGGSPGELSEELVT